MRTFKKEEKRTRDKQMRRMLLPIFKWMLSALRPSVVTKEEALAIARKHNLEAEVKEAMASGYSPEEALEEWDL